MNKYFSISYLFIVVLSFSLFANDHKYRIMLQGVDYPKGSFEIILNKLMIRATPSFSISQYTSSVNYELGFGYMPIDKPNYSIVPSMSILVNHWRYKEAQGSYFHNADKIGLGLNVAFYWYWNHLLLGGYIPFVTDAIQFENDNGNKIKTTFSDIYFTPNILIGVYF